jgi:hypothetical protein
MDRTHVPKNINSLTPFKAKYKARKCVPTMVPTPPYLSSMTSPPPFTLI